MIIYALEEIETREEFLISNFFQKLPKSLKLEK